MTFVVEKNKFGVYAITYGSETTLANSPTEVAMAVMHVLAGEQRLDDRVRCPFCRDAGQAACGFQVTEKLRQLRRAQ